MTRLLIVDDQAELRRLIRLSLASEPYELHEAADGVEGLRQALALRPALVLLDVVMPGELDGLQLCARLRAEPTLAATRVLLLSARGQAHDHAAGALAGADAYLDKPFSPLQLAETVEQLLAPR